MQSNQIPSNWNEIIAALPAPHLLQTKQWAQLKTRFGWQAATKIWGAPTNPDAAALILYRTTTMAGFGPKLKVMYLPKGPLLRDWGDTKLRDMVLNDLTQIARQNRAIFLKIDPDVPLGRGIPGTVNAEDHPASKSVLEDLTRRGFCYSDEQIQFRNTVLIDLSAPEDELLTQMKQKTRYNIRLAARKGVTVRTGRQEDLPMLYRMYAETSLRDGFAIRGEEYYRNLWEVFMAQDDPTCLPLIAEVEGDAVAAVMLFWFAGRAYYLHGMSRAVQRNKMPNFLLQWEAIKAAQNAGCRVYDLWGAPDVFAADDSMWGVFRFKQGLGGEVLRTMGAYDLPVRPTLYKFYTKILPNVLDVMRRRGKSQTEDRIAS
jgi:lipid II:glycine glycyltransferase (peptidoglycan interpeptide bridge formation enzyme)